ncbi:uncharacterized protein LOC113360462 [Papaver somniferum]|uniref:uncharacterized protein LOC113360462 n=1 Tax=Papaver somniferum TaxID=3469 RepID=UPI000E6F74FC|nr:uncharacterized protein LOC113360462 [Papaver somniferum]
MAEAGRSVMVRNVTNAIPVYHMLSFKLPDVTIKKMNSIQQTFWRKKKTNKGRPPISWKNANKPKEEGGLGFKDLKLFNRALLAKSAWRICTDNTSICAQSLKAKYFSDGRIFDSKENSNFTGSWKSIRSELPFIKNNTCWCIGNGKTILIWSYKWIPELSTRPSPKQGCSNFQDYNYVYQLFSDSGGWNQTLIFALFEAPVERLVLNTSIHMNHPDRLVWTPERNRSFSVKSAYRKMYEEQNTDQSIGQRMQSIFKRLWKLPILPRISQFIWKCLKDIL